jgi:hypothetical protein
MSELATVSEVVIVYVIPECLELPGYVSHRFVFTLVYPISHPRLLTHLERQRCSSRWLVT